MPAHCEDLMGCPALSWNQWLVVLQARLLLGSKQCRHVWVSRCSRLGSFLAFRSSWHPFWQLQEMVLCYCVGFDAILQLWFDLLMYSAMGPDIAYVLSAAAAVDLLQLEPLMRISRPCFVQDGHVCWPRAYGQARGAATACLCLHNLAAVLIILPCITCIHRTPKLTLNEATTTSYHPA